MSGYERLSREDGDVAIELSHHDLPNESATQQHDLESASSSGAPSIDATTTSVKDNEYFVNLFLVGGEQLKVVCAPEWTINQVIAAALPQAIQQGKNIRVITQGSVVPREVTLQYLGIKSNTFLHVLVTDPVPEEVNAEEAGGVAHEGHDIEPGLQVVIEDQALAMQQYEVDREGTTAHLILGFLMGTFFGPFALIWLALRTVPRKQKIGTLLGISAYALANLVQYVNQAQQTSSSDSGGSGGDGTTGDHL